MQHDAPAALPLIAYVAGLLFGRSALEAAGMFAIALLVVALRRPRAAVAVAALALGIAIAVRTAAVKQRDAAIVARCPIDRFVTIDAPIDRDWMPRGGAFLLRVPSFRVNGQPMRQPLMIYARFAPPPIELQERIVAEGFLRANERDELTLALKSPILMSYAGALSWWSPATWNRALANRLRPFAAMYPDEVALVDAIALGRGERLADSVRDSYKRGGTYHLLVFSGLQIAFAAGLLAALLRWMRAPRVSDWSLAVFAIAAPLFIGPSASVSRASIGIGAYAASRLLHRPTTLENLWCVAALARLIIAPQDISDAAFHLTYAGAGALVFVGKPLAGHRARWLVYAAGVECVVTPLTLFHFHQYALGGSLTTLALTPLISLMLLISAAACALPCAGLFRAIGIVHLLSVRINSIAATAAGMFAAPAMWALGVALLAALATIALLRGRLRAIAIVASMLIAIGSALAIGMRDVDVPTLTILDIGQGDAILLRTPRHAVLVDGGPSASRLLPLLADRGVRHIDAVVLTHAHPDHYGGLPLLLRRFDVGQLWISPRRFRGDCAQQLLEAASDALIPIHLVREGDTLAIDGAFLRAMVPDRTFRRSPENNSSIVLQVRIERRSALLTGDIERDAEAAVAPRARRSDILKVAHHGSRTSSTPLLLDAVKPRLAFVSCGRHNLFGHPHSEVLQALHTRNVTVWRTDRDGTIDIRFLADHIFVHRQIDTPR